MNSKVSVIITTKNEEKNIENCLKSVINQTYNNIELIIIDNFSTDKTVEIVKKYTYKVYLKGNERAMQRNYGVYISKGEYVIYLDADMILSSTVIEECVNKCEHENIIALYIPERIIGKGFLVQIRDFERSFYNGTVIDAVRFIRKDIFFKVNGFDENLIGTEDWDIDRKIRQIGKTGIIISCLFHNEGNFNIESYLKKKNYYSSNIQKYIIKWGIDDKEVKQQLGLFHRLFGVFIENGKWKKIIKHPIKALGILFLRVMVGITYLKNRI